MAGLPDIRLDDRNWQQLRDELVRRIPVHSELWTDHNASDPGIVLLELFAYLGENLLYRMNRAPEKARREFLNLLDIPLRPARPAQALVAFSLPRGSDLPVVIPSGGTAPATRVAAGRIEFQVDDELAVLPLEARGYLKQPVAEPAAEIVGAEGIDHLLNDHLGAPPAGGHDYYETVALPDADGGILPPVSDVACAIDRRLWVALLAPEPVVKGLEGMALQARLQQLRLAIAGRPLSLGVQVDETLCGATDHHRCPDPGSAPKAPPLQWQIATGRFAPPDSRRVDHIVYQRVEPVSDATAGLTRSGVVRLRLPAAQPGGVTPFGDWASLLDPDLLGIGELPPRLEQENDQRRVLTWLRASRPGDAPPYPRLRLLQANTVQAIQAVTADGELLGYGSGQTGQRLRLTHAPVLAGTLTLQLREGGAWRNWQPVDSLTLSLPDDRHYQLDLASGEVLFGDGVHGRIPRPGEAIRCLGYRHGGGAVGNVPAGALTRVRGSGAVATLKANNPLPASGGVDAEQPEEAVQRIPASLRHRERAVAASDFVDLAMETPDATLGRVEVLPRHKPHERIDGVPGVVTLVILPAYDPLHPDQPTPDGSLLRQVCEWLEPRRLVTTELYVTPPQYVPVWLSAAYRIEPGYGSETVRNWVELAVRQYLAPLPPYGPAGAGWPFGRAVTAADVEAAILKVEGVRLVEQVRVEGDEIGADGVARPVTGRVELRLWQLPVVRGLQLAEGDAAEPVERDEQPAGGADPLPVPVKRETC